MKRYLLLIISMVCAVTGAWATDGSWTMGNNGTVTISGSTYTINSTVAGEFATWFNSIGYNDGTPDQVELTSGITKIIVQGPVSESDLNYLGWANTTSFLMDFTGVTEGTAYITSKLGQNSCNKLLPAGMDLSSFTGNFAWIGIPNNNGTTEINVKESGGLTSALTEIGNNIQQNLKIFGTIFPADHAALTSLTTISVLELSNVKIASDQWGNDGGTLDLSSASYSYSSNSTISGTGTVTLPLSHDPYTISGNAVTINMDYLSPTYSNLSGALTAAISDLGETTIGSLTVTGEIDDTDLAALTGAAGATRIDLSGATIASGSSINNIALPASLTSLVLPEGLTTISDALRSKFAAASNLKYAYSPTSQNQTKAEQTTSPDLVWVNQPGGLNQAMINETKLMTGIYVKIESSVALNADDVNLGTNNDGTTNHTINDNDATNWPWQFVDFSGANMQQDVCLSYTKPHSKAYRIIMPDGWSGDQLAIIASLGSTTYGSLAAVYSYTTQGFLQILETNDGSYSPLALQDGRIVRSGTKAVRVVKGTYNNTTYGIFGDVNDANTNNLMAAINQAVISIEAVTITNITVSAFPLTFDNKNLIYIQIEGMHNAYNDGQGPALNVDNCASLQTLNLINSVFSSVDASVSTLTTVNMTGTTVYNGDADFSTSPITSFTTTSDTWFKKDLNLSNTSLTTFTTTAKVGTSTDGNIYLDGAPLTSVSLNQVQFQNTSSIVYVRMAAIDDSSTTDVDETTTLIGSLNGSNTIIVPENFASSTRIVPYVAIAVKEEKYVAPPYVFSATDMHLHTANQDSDGDYYVYWYTGTAQDNKVLTITTTTGGELATLLGAGNANVTYTDELVKVKISGPLASNDLTALAGLNTQILDLSEATLQKESSGTYTKDVTIFEGVSTVNSYVKFLILPENMTRDDVVENNVTTTEGIVNATSLGGFTGLYSAISLSDYDTNDAFDFVAYNKVAGTLQPAVIAAGRGTLNGSSMIRDSRTAYYPAMSYNSNRSATISGKINAYDLSFNTKLDAYGHLIFNKRYADETLLSDDRTNAGTEAKINGAFSGSNGPKTLDLRDAEIAGNEYINDICISYLVPTNYLKYLIIPENKTVKETPSYFITHNTVKEICIPSNIEVIRTHFAPSVDHIWTTAASGDANGTQFDNGAFSAVTEEASPTSANYGYTDFSFTGLIPYGTYTFSSNLKMIESGAFANTQPHVKDVYVLAKVAPECHVDAFCTAMYIGNSGFAPNIVNGVITRDSYVNGTNWIAMLHYPRECVTPNVQRYTDPTRNYSVASNEVDGKGGVLYYPNYGEFLAAYSQGTTGYLWNAWSREYEYGMLKSSLSIGNSGWTLENQQNANEKFLANPDLIAAPTNTKWTCTSFYDVTADGTLSQPSGLVQYNNVHWNEDVLSNQGAGVQLYPEAGTGNTELSFNVNTNGTESDTTDDTKVTTRDFRGWHQFVLNAYAANTNIPMQPSRSYITENRWYTVCLPYDLTWKEMLLFFGTVTASGTTTTVDETKLPQLCLLSNVVRDEVNKHITLNFSKNLMEYQATKGNDGVWTVGEALTEAQKAQTGTNDYVVLHAGVPYLIKPYLSSDATRQFDVYDASLTLGDYAELSQGRIMVSSNDYPGLYTKLKAAESMSGSDFRTTLQTNLYTVPALLPLDGDTYPSTNTENYIENETITIGDKKYYRSADYDYTFVGSFMKNVLPPYCYFLGYNSATKKAGFYYANYLDLPETSTLRKLYQNEMLWANNQGVICTNFLSSSTVSESNKYNLGKGSHNGLVSEAVANGDKTQPAQWKIYNSNVTAMLPNDLWNSSSAPVMMFGYDIDSVYGEATGINVIKTNDVMNAEGAKIFNLEGRYVGNSLEGLEKGIYIQNGKKIMVK